MDGGRGNKKEERREVRGDDGREKKSKRRNAAHNIISMTHFIRLCTLVEHPGVNLCGQEVVGGRDGMDVSCQVKVELFHRYDLRVPATRSTP